MSRIEIPENKGHDSLTGGNLNILELVDKYYITKEYPNELFSFQVDLLKEHSN